MTPVKIHMGTFPMITSRHEYKYYLEADKRALGREGKMPWWLILLDDTWRFQSLLRKVEYYTNCKKWWLPKLYRKFLLFRFNRMRSRLGFHIPINVIGPGLHITHTGPIIIAGRAKIGSNLRINIGVVIGYNRKACDVPKIGNNVVIEPGAKIFGGIEIADWVHIGANSVVNKSFVEPGIIIAGIPARRIKTNPNYQGASDGSYDSST